MAERRPNDSKYTILHMLSEALSSYDWSNPKVTERSRQLITKELPEILKAKLPGSNNYKIYGSVGMGSKAEIPWIAILDPKITTSTTAGYYIALLFSKHGQSVHVCLCVGWEQFEKLYGRSEGLKQIRRFSRQYGKSRDGYFNPGPLKLGATTARGKGYENGVLLSRKISFISMNNQMLLNDLDMLLKKYQSLKTRVGSSILNIEAGAEEEQEEDGEIETFTKKIVKHTLNPIDDSTIQQLIAEAGNRPPEVKERLLKQITRIRPFADFVKQKNNYICEICGRKPFIQKNGKPYAEADHITPLGGGSHGIDSPDNMRCLCAQCHAVITHGSDEEVKRLLESKTKGLQKQ